MGCVQMKKDHYNICLQIKLYYTEQNRPFTIWPQYDITACHAMKQFLSSCRQRDTSHSHGVSFRTPLFLQHSHTRCSLHFGTSCSCDEHRKVTCRCRDRRGVEWLSTELSSQLLHECLVCHGLCVLDQTEFLVQDVAVGGGNVQKMTKLFCTSERSCGVQSSTG